jgi:Ca-activated chloride channel family protein
MRFEDPIWLVSFVILVVAWFLRERFFFRTTIKFSDVGQLKQISNKRTKWLSKVAMFLRFFILFLIVIALARPQEVLVEKEHSAEGVDIMMVVDVSQSMAAEDFKPDNRLVVAKQTIKSFVARREADRLGLVVFGGEAFTQCPLTSDNTVLLNIIDQVDLGMAGDGTAIGMAIATAINRMKDSQAKSKVMILLTDGENNRGEIDPITAASLAQEMGIKIYTIGVGKEGGAPIPYIDPVMGKVYSSQMTYLDEAPLKDIAQKTNGRYFRATDSDTLQDIYDMIDTLEKTKIKTKLYREFHDYFPTLLQWVFFLMLFELLITNIFLVIVP